MSRGSDQGVFAKDVEPDSFRRRLQLPLLDPQVARELGLEGGRRREEPLEPLPPERSRLGEGQEPELLAQGARARGSRALEGTSAQINA